MASGARSSSSIASAVGENPAELEGVELLRRQAPPAGQAMHHVTREEVQQAPQGEQDIVDDRAPEEHAAHLLDVHGRSPHDVEESIRPASLNGARAGVDGPAGRGG